MFIHLESSSIRQLKDIFALQSEEFGDNNKSKFFHLNFYADNDINQL